jgi:acetyl-CoA/propionyl-CoA carboxylase biotin carboxyl carrier protein
MFEKVLVANRGEIAIRIIRALREMNIASVAVYSELDREALHVARADEAYLLGGPTAAESYLNVERILEVCRESGAQAVHPGYGFLAENAAFANACADAGLTFIGPPASAIEAMGSKTRARELMKAAGVPIVPGTTDPVATVDDARKVIADSIGYPVAIKAAGGGGGKGFRVAESEDELQDAFEGAAREGEKFFSDATVYLERYLPDPRHVEVQVLADRHGNVIHLGERDCSIQRRHQKLIEEAPSPAVSDSLRAEMEGAARRACESLRYRGAGTIEFLLDANGRFFFIEMNTRLQVEHPVTELATGIDVVRAQLAVAAEGGLPAEGTAPLRGHAIEFRINAEDPTRNFLPAPGTITRFRPPLGPGVRVDTHVFDGYTIPPYYDSLLAKIIVWAEDRPAAIARARRALSEFELEGVPTTRALAMDIIETESFASGDYTTAFLAEAALGALGSRL